MDTCIIDFCTRPSHYHDDLCRTHQVDKTTALMKHLPGEGLNARRAFLKSEPGQSWFADWVRMTEAVYRVSYQISQGVK